MIVRIEIHRAGDDYEYRVLAEGDVLFDDAGFSSVVHALVGAVEGLPPQVAQHAVNTTAAVYEALQY